MITPYVPLVLEKIWRKSAIPDTKKCVGNDFVSARRGPVGQMCRLLAVGPTYRRHVGDFPSQVADAGGNAPLTPHMRHCALHHRLCSMGDDLPSKRIHFLRGLGGVWPSSHSDLRQCIITGTKERFEGHTPPQHPQHYIRLLGGLSPINLTRRNEAQCLVWGVRGAFPPSAAMVVMVSPESSCLEQEKFLRWTEAET